MAHVRGKNTTGLQQKAIEARQVYYIVLASIKQLEAVKINDLTGKRVFTQTEQFNGWATVQHFITGEMFPLQIELEQPDADGHKIKRVSFDEINLSKKDNPPQESKQRFIAKVIKQRNGFKLGDKYIIGPASDPPYFNVYLLDAPNKSPIGSYMHDLFFEKIEPFTERAEIAQNGVVKVLGANTLENKQNGAEVAKRKPKRDKKNIDSQQMTMFDFI